MIYLISMWVYVLLGIIQGIFEWIPISSEGVVALISQFLVREINPLEIALFLHLGTFFAVLVYFKKDWLEILRGKNFKLLRFLITATVVSGIVGFPLFNAVKNMAIGNNLMLMTGFGLLLTAYFHKNKRLFEINFEKLAVAAGILQGLAVIPGFSRSGSTIFGLSLGKLNPEEVLKISYLMSAPVSLAAAGYLFFKNPLLVSEGWPALIFSFLVGLLSLQILIKFVAKINFFKFALIFATLCFLGAAIGFLT